MMQKPQATRLRKMRFAMRDARAHLPRALPAFFALTDPARTPDPAELARSLPTGSGLIYRHFGAADKMQVAADLSHIAARRKLVLLIANDPKLAMRVKAAGVHWPEARLHLARQWRGRFAVITSAAHSRAALWQAARAGTDAALLSAVFPSNSKSAGVPIGPLRFRKLARGADLPVYALGGVTAGNARRISAHGGFAGVDLALDVYGSSRT